MRQGGKGARALAETKNVVSGVLLLLFPKSREELSGSQNEAAAQLLTQAPAIISHVFVFTNTQYSVLGASVLLAGNLLDHAYSVKLCKDSSLLLLPEISRKCSSSVSSLFLCLLLSYLQAFCQPEWFRSPTYFAIASDPDLIP